MQAYSKLVAFDRELAGAFIPGQAARSYREEEVQIMLAQAYRKGGDDARAFAAQQLVEFRAEVQQLQDGVFKRLSEQEDQQISELRTALPILVMEVARRLLASYELPQPVVERLCEEALEQLSPERENLELAVSPRDAALIESLAATEWNERYPGLKLKTDQTLASGDCMVRSRFGLTDARQRTKLAGLAESLHVSPTL